MTEMQNYTTEAFSGTAEKQKMAGNEGYFESNPLTGVVSQFNFLEIPHFVRNDNLIDTRRERTGRAQSARPVLSLLIGFKFVIPNEVRNLPNRDTTLTGSKPPRG